MYRHSLLWRCSLTGVLLHRSVGLFDHTTLRRKQPSAGSTGTPPFPPRKPSAGSTQTSGAPIGVSQRSSPARPTKEAPPSSWSIWGQSDRIYDNQLRSPSPPPGYQSPFAKLRQRQAPQQGSSSSSFSGAAAGSSHSSSNPSRTSSPQLPRATTPTHLYANKENAWEHYTDDRYYGARRFKEYYTRMAKDRAVRYYFLGIIVLLVGAWAKLYQLEQEQRATEGLLGPKKKKYRSRLTVVLDVDETIVSFGDKAFRMKAGLVARPYLAELLDYLSSIDAEVVLWSACSERYMRQVLQVIDPNGIRISQYITKHKSWFSSDNFYEKNLFWLKRDLKDTLFIENRALSVRNCNANSILLDDFIRGEYMDSGQDHPVNDQALRVVREVVQTLEETGVAVPEYLNDVQHRHPDLKEIPCHNAIRQLPEELARGVFFFIGDKYKVPKDTLTATTTPTTSSLPTPSVASKIAQQK